MNSKTDWRANPNLDFVGKELVLGATSSLKVCISLKSCSEAPYDWKCFESPFMPHHLQLNTNMFSRVQKSSSSHSSCQSQKKGLPRPGQREHSRRKRPFGVCRTCSNTELPVWGHEWTADHECYYKHWTWVLYKSYSQKKKKKECYYKSVEFSVSLHFRKYPWLNSWVTFSPVLMLIWYISGTALLKNECFYTK